MKKFFAVLMCLIMVVVFMPTMAWAEGETEDLYCGSSTDIATWGGVGNYVDLTNTGDHMYIYQLSEVLNVDDDTPVHAFAAESADKFFFTDSNDVKLDNVPFNLTKEEDTGFWKITYQGSTEPAIYNMYCYDSENMVHGTLVINTGVDTPGEGDEPDEPSFQIPFIDNECIYLLSDDTYMKQKGNNIFTETNESVTVYIGFHAIEGLNDPSIGLFEYDEDWNLKPLESTAVSTGATITTEVNGENMYFCPVTVSKNVGFLRAVAGMQYSVEGKTYVTEGNVDVAFCGEEYIPKTGYGNNTGDMRFYDALWVNEDESVLLQDELTVKEINLSNAPDEETISGSFWVMHPAGTLEVKQVSARYQGASGDDAPDPWKVVEQNNLLTVKSTDYSITENDTVYSVSRVTLNEYIGYEDLEITFGVNNSDKVGTLLLTMGLNVSVSSSGDIIDDTPTGEVFDGLRVTQVTDELIRVLYKLGGYEAPEADFEVNNNNRVAYVSNLGSVTYGDSAGRCGGKVELSIELPKGYYLASITGANGEELSYKVRLNYYYDILKDGVKVENSLLPDIGWYGMIGTGIFNGEEKIGEVFALPAEQCLGYSGYDVAPFTPGDEDVTAFVEFCEEHGYTAELVYSNNNYEIELPASGLAAVKLNLKKIEAENTITSAQNKAITATTTSFDDEQMQTVTEKVQNYYSCNATVEKIYDMSLAEEDSLNELVDVIIPITGLSSEVSADYQVVWFNGDTPVPMETSYTDDAVVFTTGHFSKYALVKEKTDTPTIPGGSFGGGTTTDTVTNNPSDKTTTADIKTNIETGSGVGSEAGITTVKATVDQATGDKIVEKAVSNQSKEVVIDATAGQSASAEDGQSAAAAAEVGIPAAMLEAIAEKTGADVTVKTDVAEVTLDYQAVCAAAQQIAGDTVYLIVERVKDTDEEVQFELKLVCSDGSTISDFGGGNAAVTVAVPKVLAEKKIVCMYMDARGWVSRVEGSKNADGTYTFTTKHFSTYVLMSEEDAVNALDAQKEEIWNVKIALRSRQVKMKSGKKAVKLTWTSDSDIALDGVEVYRSTKRYSGYGKKPIFISAGKAYYNTSVKAGTRYYYKVRGFVEVEGEKLYTDLSAKAWRKVQ